MPLLTGVTTQEIWKRSWPAGGPCRLTINVVTSTRDLRMAAAFNGE